MLDTLALAFILSASPTQLNRSAPEIKSPKSTNMILVASIPAPTPELATSCYLATSTSCWSDR